MTDPEKVVVKPEKQYVLSECERKKKQEKQWGRENIWWKKYSGSDSDGVRGTEDEGWGDEIKEECTWK